MLKVVDGDVLISLPFAIFDSSKNQKSLFGVVNAKVENLCPLIFVFVHVCDLVISKRSFDKFDLGMENFLFAQHDFLSCHVKCYIIT